MNIGEKIKFFREIRKMNQSELSVRSGVPLDSIKKYEIGSRKPKAEKVKDIARALDVSYLFFFDDIMVTTSDVLAAMVLTNKICPIKCTKNENGDISFCFESDSLNDALLSVLSKKDASK